MRKFILSILALGLLVPSLLQAQDALKVGPGVYKLLFENERIRVLEITFKPGDKIASHSHPDHVIYVLSEGALKITRADGKITEVNAKPGQVMWTAAETHSAVNPGKTELKAIIVELKAPAK